MPEGMATGELGYLGFAGGFFGGLLEDGLMQMGPVPARGSVLADERAQPYAACCASVVCRS